MTVISAIADVVACAEVVVAEHGTPGATDRLAALRGALDDAQENFPGLDVLHDTRLHHARAAFLLRERRPDDYRAEFRWNHPDASPDLAELAVAGFDTPLYYNWPMVRAAWTTSSANWRARTT